MSPIFKKDNARPHTDTTKSFVNRKLPFFSRLKLWLFYVFMLYKVFNSPKIYANILIFIRCYIFNVTQYMYKPNIQTILLSTSTHLFRGSYWKNRKGQIFTWNPQMGFTGTTESVLKINSAKICLDYKMLSVMNLSMIYQSSTVRTKRSIISKWFTVNIDPWLNIDFHCILICFWTIKPLLNTNLNVVSYIWITFQLPLPKKCKTKLQI